MVAVTVESLPFSSELGGGTLGPVLRPPDPEDDSRDGGLGPGLGQAPLDGESSKVAFQHADQHPLRTPHAVHGRVLHLRAVQSPDGGVHTCHQADLLR